MIPYYFDLPSLEIPQEIFDMPYVQHPSDFMSPSGKGQGGRTFQYRAVPTNWYGVVKEYLDKKVNLKFGAITLLNTEPDGSSPWHAEGTCAPSHQACLPCQTYRCPGPRLGLASTSRACSSRACRQCESCAPAERTRRCDPSLAGRSESRTQSLGRLDPGRSACISQSARSCRCLRS